MPKLKHGEDAQVAAELAQYIDEAESGLRAILKAGFFLECIAADLPHGHLGPWVEVHCPARGWRTVRRWKEIAASVGEAIGMNYQQRIAMRLHEHLSFPINALPKCIQPFRAKIDAEIAGKSFRQLFLEFKQSKDGVTPDRGRRPGAGGKRALTLTEQVERARQEANDGLKGICETLLAIGAHWAGLPDEDLEIYDLYFDTWLRAKREWVNTPQNRRDVNTLVARLKKGYG